MDLIKELEEKKAKLKTLDPNSKEYQELEDGIDKCEDYLREHGE